MRIIPEGAGKAYLPYAPGIPPIVQSRINVANGKNKIHTNKTENRTTCNTLWDLVTIRSGKDCPNCQYDEMPSFLWTVCKWYWILPDLCVRRQI